MSGTTKRTVSNKKIVPVVKPEPVVETVDEVIIETQEVEKVVVANKPLIKLKANKAYSNFAIGEGIKVKPDDVIEVDFPTFQQINNDSPHAFERV